MRFRTLFGEIQFAITATAMAISVLLVGISLWVISSAMLRDLKAEALATAAELSAFLEYPLYNVDDVLAVHTAQTFLTSGKIAGIVLESTAGGVLLSENNGTASSRIPAISRNISRDGLLLGAFTVTFSDAVIPHTQRQYGLIAVVVIAAVLLANLLANRFIIAPRVKKPFADIVAAFGTMAEGNYAAQIPQTRYSDINVLIALFNDMASKIDHKNQQQKAIEQELRASERRFKAVFNQTFQLIGLIAPDGSLLSINQTALDFLGLEDTDVLARPLWDIPWWPQSERQRDAVRQAVAQAASGDFVRLESTLPGGRVGEPHVFDCSLKPVFDEHGHIALLIAEGRDITERKQAEEAIRAERRYLLDIIDFLPDATLIINTNREVVAWNRAAEAMTGVSRDELLGRGDYAYAVPFFAQQRPMLIDLIDSPEKATECEYSSIRRTGETLYAEGFAEKLNAGQGLHLFGVAAPLYDRHGQRTGAIEMVRDITEAKLAEQDNSRLQEQLAQAQKMESVGRLAGGVAHDFNNMLTAILGHVQLAMRHSAAPNDPVLPHLKVVEDAAFRSTEIVRQLLAFARKQTIAPQRVDINNSIPAIFKMLLRLIGEDIHLTWKPGAQLWPVMIDPSQLDQVVVNLCVNARDAVAAGGTITLETANVAFDGQYCRIRPDCLPGEYVMLAISDDGCGMTKEVLNHIFEPFFSTKEVGKGSGLGLATVYGIVKQNKGFINVYSEPGRGTAFKLYLPRCAGDVEQPVVPQTPAPRTGNGETILLVEDEEVILELGKEMLEALGYRVLTASRPSAALSLAKKHADEVRLLVTDVVMPEMNGRELEQLIKAIKPGLRSLFTSGYTEDAIAHHGVLDEGVCFLQKPYTLLNLAAKVDEILQRP